MIKNKPIQKSKKLKKSYGITLDDYNDMFLKQEGLCDICCNPEVCKTSSGAIKMLSVDHCHISGKVRGLLCTKCNTSLGGFNDSISMLLLAIKYLNENS